MNDVPARDGVAVLSGTAVVMRDVTGDPPRPYDAIRSDVRTMSPAQPVNDVAVCPSPDGYRGLLEVQGAWHAWSLTPAAGFTITTANVPDPVVLQLRMAMDDAEQAAANEVRRAESLEEHAALIAATEESIAKANANGDVPAVVAHTGHCVMLAIPADVAADIVQRFPIDSSPDELHITLAYLGKGLTDEQSARIASVCAQLASTHGGFRVTFGGIAWFAASSSSDGQDVCVLLVDSPAIVGLRHTLVDMLWKAGVRINETHGFTPHLTIRYGAPGVIRETITELEWSPFDATITEVTYAAGGVRRHFAFNTFLPNNTRMLKALPRQSAEDKEPKLDTKAGKAGKVAIGEGGKPRYTYPAEKGGGHGPVDPAEPPPPKRPAEAASDPSPVPGPTKKNVDVDEVARQLGVAKPFLLRVAKRFLDESKLGGRNGFIRLMQKSGGEFAQKHGLDDDYFGLLFDALAADPEV